MSDLERKQWEAELLSGAVLRELEAEVGEYYGHSIIGFEGILRAAFEARRKVQSSA